MKNPNNPTLAVVSALVTFSHISTEHLLIAAVCFIAVYNTVVRRR